MHVVMPMIFPVLLVSMMGLLIVTWILASWADLLPDVAKERLVTTLRRVCGQQGRTHGGTPVYSVRLGGELLYASGKADVEDYLCTAWMHVGRRLLSRVSPERPVEIVVMCGEETAVVQVQVE